MNTKIKKISEINDCDEYDLLEQILLRVDNIYKKQNKKIDKNDMDKRGV